MLKPKNPIAVALYVNALLLACILGSLITSKSSPSSSTAFAQNQPPIAGGAGVFVMPCQLGTNQWGCYLLDVDSQSLVTYMYEPGVRKFSFVAARTYKNDRFLHDFATFPPTADVKTMVDRERGMEQKKDDKPAEKTIK